MGLKVLRTFYRDYGSFYKIMSMVKFCFNNKVTEFQMVIRCVKSI